MANPKFPGAIWDGSSKTRATALDKEPPRQVYRSPDGDDWSQIVEEMIAVEQALQTTTLIAGAGNTAALATSATVGFGFIPKVAGTPTGVPANVPAGYVAWCYNTTGHTIHVYDGGWKASAALT